MTHQQQHNLKTTGWLRVLRRNILEIVSQGWINKGDEEGHLLGAADVTSAAACCIFDTDIRRRRLDEI